MMRPSWMFGAPRGRPVALVLALGFGLPLAGLVALAARLGAQIEGDRGIPAVGTTGDIEVTGIAVNTTGKTPQEARGAGYKAAYRAAWAKIGGPALGDDAIAALVTQVEVGGEQIGPHRYIATLGVVFDRARAGSIVAGGGGAGGPHSAPMLVIPVLYSGGVAQVFEVKGAWQRAWAEFKTGASLINYVRPSGSGGDSLILTAGQPGRRSRVWWHELLAQYGASDVLIPTARLERQWPGGPVNGTFTARFGPDNRVIESFTLAAPDEEGVPAMLAGAVQRLDQIYGQALSTGALHGEADMAIDHPAVDPALQAVIAAGQRAAALAASAPSAGAVAGVGPAEANSAEPRPAAASYTVQFASPDAAAVDAALAGVRGAPGVGSAATVSLAIGGTSVMRVNYSGSLAELAAALRGHGFQVTVGAGALRIRRGG